MHPGSNGLSCLGCWKKLKIYCVSYKDLDGKRFWKTALESSEFKDLLILLETYLTVPLSTVECERVFSKMNLTKNDHRSALNTQTLDALLEIGLNGPNIGEFNFSQCIFDWKDEKRRYFI